MNTITITLDDLAKYSAMLSAALTSELIKHTCNKEQLLELYNSHLSNLIQHGKVLNIVETFNKITDEIQPT